MDDTNYEFSSPYPDDQSDEHTEVDHAIAYAWLLGIDVYFEDDSE